MPLSTGQPLVECNSCPSKRLRPPENSRGTTARTGPASVNRTTTVEQHDREGADCHLAGPNATIQNTPPLVTSNKARAKHKLPLLTTPDSSPARFDVLRPQRLAAPATVYVEQFSAHPLEADMAELYARQTATSTAPGSIRSNRAPATNPSMRSSCAPRTGFIRCRTWRGRWTVLPGTKNAPPGAKARQGFFPDGSRSRAAQGDTGGEQPASVARAADCAAAVRAAARRGLGPRRPPPAIID
jgi:hypothetical protein